MEEREGFIKFYAIYPRKVGRLDAEKAWRQMIGRGYGEAEIIAGAERYAQQCARECKDKQFVPYPATWLRAGRWMDEPDERSEALKRWEEESARH